MFSLKNQPFAVEAFFKSSIVLTFAVPKEALQNMIPECLQLDVFNEKWAFVAVALVDTKNLRPKGFPAFLGNDFFLVGYRIFVRYENNKGRKLRGLYILKSETNKKKMEWLGNVFTHYKYETTDISIKHSGEKISVSSVKSALNIEILQKETEIKLPVNSPFADWKEARRFAGPLPFTFSYNQDKKEVLIIEGVRESWVPKHVQVLKSKVGFVDDLNIEDTRLANAFIIQNIPYFWKKGKIEKWKS